MYGSQIAIADNADELVAFDHRQMMNVPRPHQVESRRASIAWTDREHLRGHVARDRRHQHASEDCSQRADATLRLAAASTAEAADASPWAASHARAARSRDPTRHISPDARVLVEPPAHRAEAIGKCDVNVFVPRIAFRIARHGDLAARHDDVDPHMEMIVTRSVVVRFLDEDRATLDAIAALLETADPAADRFLHRRARCHSAKRDVQWCVHHSAELHLASQTNRCSL
ncbi:MAG TPA: hypothetical protein VFB62_23695 [Polyangiaceae bacterium]|nr:hypothetical protein [Polyangiaceae bacterium]